MPIAKTWTEELVLEWLQLKGYVTLQNVRLRSGSGGGVKEADILGLKLRKEAHPEDSAVREILEILHVEVGSLSESFEKNFALVKNKFGLERKEAVREISVDIVELESLLGKFTLGSSRLGASNIYYKPLYVASYVAEKQIGMLREGVKKEGIEFLTLKEVLREIPSGIEEWKRRQVGKGFRKSEEITLPESWWLLNLIDYLRRVENVGYRT